MIKSIQKAFTEEKTLFLAGISRNPRKFGSLAAVDLKKRGYTVIGIHPTESLLHGIPCQAEFSGAATAAVFSVKPDLVPGLLRQAATAGIRRVWLTPGCESDAAQSVAADLNLDLITGTCILMVAEPVTSIHKLHQIWCRWTGSPG